jgi:hypothetical protein
VSTVEPVSNIVKPVSNATINRAVVVPAANVPKERHVAQTCVRVDYAPVVVVLMSIVSTVSAYARQTFVTNATMPVNRMRSVSKANVFAKIYVPKVHHTFLLIILEHRSPSSSFLPISLFKWWTMYGFL